MSIDVLLCNQAWIQQLPGAALVLAGIQDLLEERISVGACLAAIALPKLQRVGLVSKGFHSPIVRDEITLYRLLLREKGNAYGRYNALIRELVSFERAIISHTQKNTEDSIV